MDTHIFALSVHKLNCVCSHLFPSFSFLLSGALKKRKNCLYLSKSLLRYTMRLRIKRLNGFLEIVKIDE